MSLRMSLRRSSESDLEEGTPTEIAAKKWKIIRDARLEAARSNPNWREVSESALVSRPPKMLVDADTGSAFRIYRGEVFSPGSVTVAFVSDRTMMWFYVRDDDEIQFLEYVGQWDLIYAKRVR